MQKREAPIGVPATTDPNAASNQGPKVSGGSFEERIAYVRGPESALVVAAVYRAVNLRADTMSVMPVQYQKRDFEGGNYVTDMRGLGKRINYLLQEEPNPIMSAADMWKLVEINRLFYGNAFVYIERDEFGFPARLWLVKTGGYNIATGTYSSIVYLTDHSYETRVNVPREDVLHFANTFRYQNGIWGIPTLQYAIETLSLNRTIKQQALETAAKGGRVKGFIGEDTSKTVSPIAAGLFDKSEMDKYAEEIQSKLYKGHDIIAIRGLDKFVPISMTGSDMQMFEQLGGTNDDVSRFFGVPRPLLMLDTNSHYNDYKTEVNVPREDVLHFANTFRYQNGIWGIPTLQYAIETLSLNRTIKQQALETAAKGGRVKGFIGEDTSKTVSPIAAGLFDKSEMDKYAEEIQSKLYKGHDIIAIRGLDKFVPISMTGSDMQMFEQLGGTNDDVSRFFGVPRPLLMLDTNSHYNDYQNATMEFHTRTILPQKTGNEKEIARKLIGFKDYGVRRIHICEKPLLAMDPERQAKVDLMNLQTGAKTINEVRAEHDMPSVKDGDTPMASANLMTLQALIAKSKIGQGKTNDKNKRKPAAQNGGGQDSW